MSEQNDVVVTHEPPPDAAISLLNFVAQAVKDPAIDVTKLEALLRMQREIVADDSKAQFNRDFMALSAVLPRIKKNGTLEYPDKKTGKIIPVSKYAKWEDIDKAIRPLLESHGFALSFSTEPRQGGGLIVRAILRHRAGHSTETPIPIPLDTSGGKNDIQGYGSALSYGKRYAATAALNIIAEGEDDDGVRGGMRFVDASQEAELNALIEQTGTDATHFLSLMCNARSTSEVEERDFVRLKNALLEKKRRKGGA